jgi:hypothetical protein
MGVQAIVSKVKGRHRYDTPHYLIGLEG